MYETILALLAQHKRLSAAELTAAIGRPERSVRNALTNLMFEGRIQAIKDWNGPMRYRLPKAARPFPSITCGRGRYQFPRPSGLRPEQVRARIAE